MKFRFTILLACCLLGFVHGQTGDSPLDTGNASYYGEAFHGLETSNGETYNQNDFTAAHRSMPFNTILHVLNKLNGKGVIVRINDRGPYKRSRILDLSHSAAKKIGMVPFGVVPVQIQVLTLLDYIPMSDTSFLPGEVWDCFGNRIGLKGKTVCVWSTSFWKHAFYMATQLSLELKLEHVVVRISGQVNQRLYTVLITGLGSKSECNHWADKLIQSGFMNAHFYSSAKPTTDPESNLVHADR